VKLHKFSHKYIAINKKTYVHINILIKQLKNIRTYFPLKILFHMIFRPHAGRGGQYVERSSDTLFSMLH